MLNLKAAIIACGIFLSASISVGIIMYTPLQRGVDNEKEKIKTLVKNESLAYNNDSKQERQVRKRILEPAYKHIVEFYVNDRIYNNTTIDDYFSTLLQRIKKHNPTLRSSPLNVYVVDYPFPNAFTTIEDRIYINIGLINQVETEGQLIFVFCHELAHYKLKHSKHFIDEYVDFWSSKETKKRINDLKNSRKVDSTTIQLFEKYIFDERAHSRYNEFAADSMGMILFTNAGFDPKDAVATMDMLEHSDELANHNNIFSELLDFEEYPLKEPEDNQNVELSSFFAKKKEANKEKWKQWRTHPECVKRKKRLKHQTVDQSSEFQSHNVTTFEKMKKWAPYECILSNMDYGNYELALHQILLSLEQEKENPYLVYLMGQLFNNMSEALSNYEGSKLIRTRSDFLGEHHKSIYEFMHSANSKDFDNWSYYFLKSHYGILYEHEELLEEWNRACINMNDKSELQKIYTYKQKN